MDKSHGERWEALSIACLEANQEVVMAWHPPPPPPPFLKRILILFVLMPYMLQHYDWEETQSMNSKFYWHNTKNLKVANGRIGLKMSSCLHMIVGALQN